MSEVKIVSVDLGSKIFCFPELQITSSCQQYRKFLAGIMYTFFVVITILFAICCCLAVLGKPTFNHLLRSASYQAYYYLLGSKGILEDYVYAKNNKTRTYICIIELCDMFFFKSNISAVTVCTKLAIIFPQATSANV
jgi:hypothetical protein